MNYPTSMSFAFQFLPTAAAVSDTQLLKPLVDCSSNSIRTAIGVFRDLPNINDGAFLEKHLTLFAKNSIIDV